MPLLRQPPAKPASATLAERIEAIHAEVQALIEDHIAAEKAQCPGIPETMLRQMFDARYGVCACRVHSRLEDERRKTEDPEGWELAEETKRQKWIRENVVGV